MKIKSNGLKNKRNKLKSVIHQNHKEHYKFLYNITKIYNPYIYSLIIFVNILK